jgi:E-phenylitaconyl-CoA hydratase
MLAKKESEKAMAGTVLYERDGKIATITFNRPEALNAMNAEVSADYRDAWHQFRDDPDAWVAIITGNGRAFCAGMDVKEAARRITGTGTSTNRGSLLDARSLETIETGLEVWKPTIAAVNGYCLGHGLTVAVACDFVIANEYAEFGFPEVMLGMPTVIGAIRLADRGVAWHYAMEVLLTGERFTAARAMEMGFIWKVVPHDRLMDEARALAGRLCAAAPLAVRVTKEATWRGMRMPLIDGLRMGAALRATVNASDDYREGVLAKAEHRDPKWQGR